MYLYVIDEVLLDIFDTDSDFEAQTETVYSAAQARGEPIM